MSDYVPVENFGPDHWSTLAYAETVMMECGGFQVGYDARMRQGRRNYRVMQEECRRPSRPTSGGHGVVMEAKYSTVLKDGSVEVGHDDWSCVQDMVVAGLMGIKEGDKIVTDVTLMEPSAVLHLTEEGQRLSNQVRAHKRGGGSWRDFAPAK